MKKSGGYCGIIINTLRNGASHRGITRTKLRPVHLCLTKIACVNGDWHRMVTIVGNKNLARFSSIVHLCYECTSGVIQMDNEKLVIDMLTEMNKTMLSKMRTLTEMSTNALMQLNLEQKELKLEMRLGFSEVQKSLGGIRQQFNWKAFESNTGAGQGFCLGDCLKEKKLLLHSCGNQNETASCPCVRLKYFFNLWLTQGQVAKPRQKNHTTAPRSSTQMLLQFVANSWVRS